jgi:hypothetical protein
MCPHTTIFTTGGAGCGPGTAVREEQHSRYQRRAPAALCRLHPPQGPMCVCVCVCVCVCGRHYSSLICI